MPKAVFSRAFSVAASQEQAVAVSLVKEKNWFAFYTTPRHEKRVAEYLIQFQVEHFLPTYRSARRWKDGSKQVLDLPLFPNYIFVFIEWQRRVRVLGCPGVLSVVGSNPTAAALADETIGALRSGLKQRRAEPHPYLTQGERVRIRSGALAGLEGIVVRAKNSTRVVLTLDQIMRSVAVEVDACDLESVQGARPAIAYN